jgi:hypothetical protein
MKFSHLGLVILLISNTAQKPWWNVGDEITTGTEKNGDV